MAREAPETAYKAAVFRTIPNSKSDINVSTSSATDTTTLAPLAGKYVWLAAAGGDVTVLRGSHTVLAKEGLVIQDGTFVEVFVPPNDSTYALSHIGSAACTLHVLYDSENG